MTDASTDFDLQDSDIFAVEVADEVLEAAACTPSEVAGAFTIAMCTGNLECPF